jgi:hypothetical protein
MHVLIGHHVSFFLAETVSSFRKRVNEHAGSHSGLDLSLFMLGESHQGEVKNITTIGRNLFCHAGELSSLCIGLK